MSLSRYPGPRGFSFSSSPLSGSSSFEKRKEKRLGPGYSVAVSLALMHERKLNVDYWSTDSIITIFSYHFLHTISIFDITVKNSKLKKKKKRMNESTTKIIVLKFNRPWGCKVSKHQTETFQSSCLAQSGGCSSFSLFLKSDYN